MVKYVLTCLLLLLTVNAHAAQMVDYFWEIAFVACAIAAGFAYWRVQKIEMLDTFLLKAVGFGAIFWIVIFIEAILYAIVYSLTK